MNLPEAFLKRMRSLPDYEAFVKSYELPPARGVRVNTLKVSAEEFAARCPFPLGGVVPWERNGFYTEESKLGRYLMHAQGLFYSQEPSAMCAVPLLDVKKGERVLDLCAAPGGKGTQIAAKLGGEGLLVLNEKMPDRAKVLARNAERLGIRNAVVLNEEPSRLESRFASCFDKILADAPCSGEGMFKKEEGAAEEWSEENVAMCAARQRLILESAARMLRAGGTLVYSTCTFSEAEDEGQVAAFLRDHPVLSLEAEEILYPHRVRGEGHYAAKLVKKDGEMGDFRRENGFAGKRETALYRAVERDFYHGEKERLFLFGREMWSLPEGCFSLDGLKVLRAGIPLATLQKDRFEPHHGFAMAEPLSSFLRVVEADEEEAQRYLRGESLSREGENGWCAVSYGGFALGVGKSVNGTVKNHLPKGLRTVLKNS